MLRLHILAAAALALAAAGCGQTPSAPGTQISAQSDDNRPPTRGEVEESVQRGLEAEFLTPTRRDIYHYTALHTEIAGDVDIATERAPQGWPVRMTVRVVAEREGRDPEVTTRPRDPAQRWFFSRGSDGRWSWVIGAAGE